MTKITVKQLNDGWLFDCEGHSGFAKSGGDIVCAGISALCMALAERSQELTDENIAKSTRINVCDGEVHIRLETDSDKLKEILLKNTVETVMAGFKAIEEKYPEYVYCDW
ncbi:MAG: ribosomal-processing cysteine protease Prp [Oscillospiraceae bacterium]|nr:ribosomal-processing cysteine protease Prp [Oscillospiraceae bacterium]